MPLKAYLAFVATDRRFVAFGFMMAVASSFGQTHFIAIFGPSLQNELGLGHTAWGTIYMLGTLASALVLPWTGKLIDHVDLRHFTTAVAVGLAGACLLAAATMAPWMLVLAVFALRQTGQGLSSHTASTSMVRYFDDGRGRAIAIAALGFAAGEAVLPYLAVSSIAAYGWRATYVASACIQLLVFLPIMLWLLRGHTGRHRAWRERMDRLASTGGEETRSWSRTEVLRDLRFYLLMPGLFAPSLVITALFFHHLNIADAKGWTHGWITGSYSIYAIVIVVFSLFVGPLIDRFGAMRLVPSMLVPMIAGLLLLATTSSPWVVFPYMALIGGTSAISHTAVNAMWAELYGVEFLGAIKSLAFALSVFASALGPVSMGALMDLGVSVDQVLIVLGIYAAIGSVLLLVALRLPGPGRATRRAR